MPRSSGQERGPVEGPGMGRSRTISSPLRRRHTMEIEPGERIITPSMTACPPM
ncbi:MAG: hypothetical protein WKG00_12185 [Polyangiaceae bacterium]